MRAKLLMIIFCLSQVVQAQTWDEWFEQEKTQKKYLLQQIAALEVYLDYAKKGYDIANKGLQTIHDIKKGDFNLHRDFFISLKLVNPTIKNWSKVAEIIVYQAHIIKEVKKTLKGVSETGQFTNEELDYCKMVFDNLLDECLKNIDELIMIITSGELEMKDDERIRRIENLYADMQDKYSFAASFGEEMGLLAVQRLGEQLEIDRSKLISAIK